MGGLDRSLRVLVICSLILSVSSSIVSTRSYAQMGVEPDSRCKCVIFRFDDVQDHFVQPAQLGIMDLFLLKNQPLSLGLIMGRLGTDTLIVEKVLEGTSRGLFELGNHSWDHQDHSQLNKLAQLESIQHSNEKMVQMFGDSSDVFIAPYNKFDANTLDIMSTLGMRIISSETDLDKFPYFIADGRQVAGTGQDDSEILHMPAMTAFRTKEDAEPGEPKHFAKVPLDRIVAEIDASIASYGYAVVMMHPQDFVVVQDGRYTKVPDENEIRDLGVLIDRVLARGYTISTFSKVAGLSERNYSAASSLGLIYGVDRPLNIFTLGKKPSGIAINSASGIIFATNSESSNVSVLDASSHTVIFQTRTDGPPFGIAVNPVTDRVYVSNWPSDTISVLDGSTASVLLTLPVGSPPFGIAVNPVTDRVYVSSLLSDTISVLDGSTGDVVDVLSINGRSTSLAVNSIANVLYAVLPDALDIIDLDSGEIRNVKFESKPDRVAFNSTTNMIYVTHSRTDSLSVVDGNDNRIVAEITVGQTPIGVAVYRSTNTIYVANTESDTVSVIDGNTNTLITNVRVGTNPVSIDIDESRGIAYVANIGSNSISVIDYKTAVVPEFPLAAVALTIGLLALVAMRFSGIAAFRKTRIT